MKLPCILGLSLFAAGPTAVAANLYTWKDANGVTHYSETPPEGQRYESRRIDTRGDPLAPQSPTTATESPQCTTARRNLEILSGDGPVGRDTDGDGKPDTPLDETQRAAERNLADAGVKAYCTPATAGH